MKKHIWFTIYLLGLPVVMGGQLYSQQKTMPTIAVVDFQNNTGNTGLGFLSKSLSENVATRFAESKKFIVIERMQISKILKEMELQQMGLTPANVKKTGELLHADYLVVGSYSGKSSALNVEIRALDVVTGEVKIAKTASGEMDNIIPLIGEAANQIIISLAGGSYGFLTIQSTPPGAKVFLDGNKIGETPLTGYSVSTGEHSLLVQKNFYVDHRQKVQIVKGKEEILNIVVEQNEIRNLSGIHFGVFYTDFSLFDFTMKGISPSMTFQLGYYYKFSHLRIGLDFAYTMDSRADYDYLVPYGKYQDKRFYTLFNTGISLMYIPFLSIQSVSPYIGLHASYINIKDHRELTSSTSDVLENYGGFATGPVLGLSILPYGGFSIFIEARYSITVGKVLRSQTKSVALTGQVVEEPRDSLFGYLTIGGGFSVQF